MANRLSHNPTHTAPTLLLLAAYLVLLVTFVGVRFDWRWQDGDSAHLTRSSEGVYHDRALVPSDAHNPYAVYPWGYAYPVLNTSLSHITRLSIKDLQRFVQPYLIVLLVPVIFVLFRSLTEDAAVSVVAAFLLFLQPEFLFEALRSSHAKLTWLLALTAITILVNRFNCRTVYSFAWIGLFYLVLFALFTSNAFFASIYMIGLTIASVGTQLMSRLFKCRLCVHKERRRLLYLALSFLVLLLLYSTYLYPPIADQVAQLSHIFDQVRFLILTPLAGSANTATNPYHYIAFAWPNPWTYLLLTSLTYLILAASFLQWIRLVQQALFAQKPLSRGMRFLLSLYASFAGLLAASVALDAAGVLSANLQVRLLPHFMVFAVPLASHGLLALLCHLRRVRRGLYRGTVALLVCTLPVFALFSVVKATNEPLISSNWTFYTDAEEAALEWSKGVLVNTDIWIGLNPSRLSVLVRYDDRFQANDVQYVEEPDQAYYYLSSSNFDLLAQRRQHVLPNLRDKVRIYDNGEAAWYKQRPQTPYQR